MQKKMIDQKEAIKNLQTYLREISYHDTNIPPVAIDGIYDTSTREAVINFQREYGLVPNGIVNKKTWDSIYKIYKKDIATYCTVEGIFPCASARGGNIVEPNEKSDLVMIIQIMLSTLQVAYDELGEIEISGIYDEKSMNAVKEIQKCNSLPQTGIVDLCTWNHLATNYNHHLKKS